MLLDGTHLTTCSMVLCCTSTSHVGFSPLTIMAYSLKPLLMRFRFLWFLAFLTELWQQPAVLCVYVHEPLSWFCVPAHIDSHMMYSCTIHNMMYLHCNTCIGDRASPNKLNILMTLQCIEIVACNVYIYKWCEVCYPQLFEVHESHFKSSANESLSPFAQLHRTCQHSEPKFHVRLWFTNASYLTLTVSSYCSLSSTPPLRGCMRGIHSLYWR